MDSKEQIFAERLKGFSSIQQHYQLPFLSTFKLSHPFIRHLFSKEEMFEFDLDFFNYILEKIETKSDIRSIIKQTKSSENFFNHLSEIKVIAELIDKVDCIVKLQEGANRTPDLKIHVENYTFTIEVKRIRDKLSIHKTDSDYAQIFDDVSTLRNQISESYEEKKQFLENIPHIIAIDCEFSSVDDFDFPDLLYLLNNELEYNYRLAKVKDPDEKTEKIFHKTDDSGHYIYTNLSGVIGIFRSSSNNKNSKVWRFYRNPFVKEELKIPEDILKIIDVKLFQISDDALKQQRSI